MFDALQQELLDKGQVTFAVRIRPSAPVSKYLGTLDDESIKIAIAAPPERGKANAELTSFLAKEFSVSTSQVSIITGLTIPHKLIRVTR